MDLKEVDILGDAIAGHWYYRSKAAALARLLGSQSPGVILDVGAGSGFFSRYLLAHTRATTAWCVDISYAADADTAQAGKPIHFRRALESADADLVLMMDVLEHVENDVGLLADYVRKVPARARFVVSVPAFPFLWSAHDEFLEHKRRYRLARLEEVVRGAGLRVEKTRYYFGLVFPLAVATRLVGNCLRSGEEPPRSQLRRHARWSNQALTLLCRAELPLLAVNRLAGLSLFCLARRA